MAGTGGQKLESAPRRPSGQPQGSGLRPTHTSVRPLESPILAEHDLEQRERRVEVDCALGSLSAEHRMVLTLVAMEGMSSADAAAHLGVPEGTLWSRYSRARIALARRLKDLGID